MILSKISQVASEVTGVHLDARYNPASMTSHGDVGIPLHVVNSPDDMKAALRNELNRLPFVANVNIIGSFLNVVLEREIALADIVGETSDPSASQADRTVVLEHTSINPNAAPHVGRARNAILGDSIARLLKATGAKVQCRYFVNDFGKQIALLLVAFGHGGVREVKFADVLTRYVEINEKAATDDSVAQAALEFLGKAEAGDTDILQSLKEIARHSLDGQTEILARLGVTFDSFDFETDLLSSAEIDRVENHLAQINCSFVDDDGRLVVDLSVIGHSRDDGRFLVLRRANGSSMYVLRDLAYNIKKAQLSADGRNIVVLGEDHKLYMEQVGSILDSMGYSPPEQVYYSYVTLKDGKMSTRRGNVVLLDEFIDLAEELATQRVQTANPAMSEQDVAAVAKDVSVAAVRFSLLRSAPSSPIVFSLDTAVRFEGATGPYLQYTAVRCRAVLAKAENFPTSEKPSISEELWAVVTMIDEYPDVLARSAERLQPNLICDYLLRLAKVVNRFYAKEQVISSGTADKRSLMVLEKVVEVLSAGLDTLGIKVPERM